MKYTLSKQADKKIEGDMKFIVEEIKKRIPSTISIFLTGGFSRGEGPIKKINGKFYPYNDYDIQIIVQKKISKEETDQIASEISQKLGYGGINEIFYPFKKENQNIKNSFYIDLKCGSPKDLTKLLPRIRNYELRNNSKLLYGKDLRYLIPDYKLNKIPFAEGAKLLLDRMSQMVEYFSLEGKHEKECLTYFIQQAYAACCTSLLLLSRKYKIGYLKSMKILKRTYQKDFPELYKNVPRLHLKIEQFIKWKINPQKLPNENVEEEWFIAKESILEVSKYFFSRFLGTKIKDETELAKGIYNMQRQFHLPYLREMVKNKFGIYFGGLNVLLLPFVSLALKWKYYQRLKQNGIKKFSVIFEKSPDLIIFASLIFLIDCINDDGIDEEKLKKAKKLLSKVYPVKSDDWENISVEYANAYIAFFMQKL